MSEFKKPYGAYDLVEYIEYKLSGNGISKNDIHMITKVIVEKANEHEMSLVDDMMEQYEREKRGNWRWEMNNF